MDELRTDYKDRLLDTSVNTERKFNLVDQDGNVIASGVSLRDITQYSQAGDTFGAADINKITEKINEQNSNLTQNVLCDYIDLADYTSLSNAFIFPEDGYLYLENHIDTKGRGMLYDANGEHGMRIGAQTADQATTSGISIYVKKGMKFHVLDKFSNTKFFPFANT